MTTSENGSDQNHATILAGVPADNLGLYRRIRFKAADPAALIDIPGQGSTLIIRAIEMERARTQVRVDRVACPEDFPPNGWGGGRGLSGDRETSTAQGVAQFLRQAGVGEVVTDRTLPMIFAHFIEMAGVRVICDPEMGVLDRRRKDEQEIEHLRQAQRMTEQAVEMACRLIGGASTGKDGVLMHEGEPLTSERMFSIVDVWLLKRGYENLPSIIAGGPQGGDCHNRGAGPLYTGQPIIVDIFPRNKETLYHGDCTRTVVHGEIPDPVRTMHEVVVEAKHASEGVTRAGATGEQVHEAAAKVITAHGYAMGLPGPDESLDYTAMVHGTGHGVGLSVHEPPLLDRGGPELIAGDVLTIEPGLYSKAIGGVRVEDMVVVTAEGCENFNTMPEGLVWV